MSINGNILFATSPFYHKKGSSCYSVSVIKKEVVINFPIFSIDTWRKEKEFPVSRESQTIDIYNMHPGLQ